MINTDNGRKITAGEIRNHEDKRKKEGEKDKKRGNGEQRYFLLSAEVSAVGKFFFGFTGLYHTS